ncbi:MAG: acyl-CoA dehydrogenase family protein, partial [Actinomycetota bacterium]|nr:acyl-CoA dehydrogenase family protein [Actinomycetota bacterium]
MVFDLAAAATAVDTARSVCERAAARLAQLATDDSGGISVERLDRHQVVAYDLAHARSAVEGSRVMVGYGAHGEAEAALACLYVAEAIWDLSCRLYGREGEWGLSVSELEPAREFMEMHRSPEFLEQVAASLETTGTGPPHLADEFEMVRDTFRRFAADKVRPVAEEVHRKNSDIPEEVISGLAELGGFGLSVPEEYGGFASGDESDYLGMVIATEELSWGSLGVGGSLITRPEILTRALVRGGTEDQKREWLPRIATGEARVGVMVTEPDFGSDVANLKVTATRDGDRWRINGVKTWATFAGRANTLMLLVRTDPDRSKGHRGLSLFVVEKPEAPGHH